MIYENLQANQVEIFLQQPDAIVIDIRDIHSYRAAHIEGALHISGPTMGNLMAQRKNNPPVLIYCYHGNSSKDVAEMVSGFGFSKISHLVGGWEAWAHFKTQSANDNLDCGEAFAGAVA